MVDGWTIGFVANATIAAAYLAVAALLATNAIRTNQWRTNTLGLATVFLYVTCGGGHGVYALQMFEAMRGGTAAYAEGARILYAEWHMWGWDVVTAIVGIWYWTMRRRFSELVTGTAVFEDLRIRQRRALEVNDNVVQGLAQAKLSYELGRKEDARRALASTHASGQRLVDQLNTTGGGAE